MRTLLLLLILTAFPALAAPLTDYLQSADTVFRDAALYRRYFVADLGRLPPFGDAVYKSASDYSRSMRSLQARFYSLTPPGEAANYHESLRALVQQQTGHAASFVYYISQLKLDKERLAQGLKWAEEHYNSHQKEFLEFTATVDSVEKPKLDKVIELRSQLKPEFKATP